LKHKFNPMIISWKHSAFSRRLNNFYSKVEWIHRFRAFRAVGGDPLFIKKSDGALSTDEDDNAYIELTSTAGGRWSLVIITLWFGRLWSSNEHGTSKIRVRLQREKLENRWAHCIYVFPSVEKGSGWLNSALEATMSCHSCKARGYTGAKVYQNGKVTIMDMEDSFLDWGRIWCNEQWEILIHREVTKGNSEKTPL